MGIFDDLTGSLESAIGNIFGGSDNSSGSYLGGLNLGVPSSYPVSYPSNYPSSPYPTVPEYGRQPVYQQTMAMAPMIARGASMIAARFPNLYIALNSLRSQYGSAITLEKLWGMVKSLGPQALVGLMGAAALQELFVYRSTHKRRRMNVANTRALRRSVRRLKGFDRLSRRVSGQLARAGGTRRRSASRRCGTCHKAQCVC